ncbi:MAG: hypothetical protein IKE46_00345, partial [Selenomonadaceae bacterium]|nr:hypothetical protein [Selenomonadaceae bacterium]
MADNVGSIYVSLGLSLSELETDLVSASQTINTNIRRLNREADLISLRAEVEIAGLDEVADAERILQIRQDALNRQMSLQRDRVRLLDAEYRHLVATQGDSSVAAQRVAIRLERERLALANLGNDLRELNEASNESSGVFGELSNLLPEIPTKFQAVGMAASAITAGIGAAATAVQDLLEQFRELQNQSYELNMSLPDTKQFLRQVKLGGGDIGDIEGYIRGITDAYVKGEYDDPEFIALRKYGAQITDATGRLKEFKDITDEVYRAWEKADAAGEGIEFLQLTGGESGVRDIIQYFQRLKEAREDAAQIFNADIDTKQLHELDRAFGRLEEQSSELKAAIGDIFVPAAQAAADKLFDTVRDGTQTLVENKDAIQRWGFIVAETFSTIESKLDSPFGGKIALSDTFALTPSGYLDNARKALRDLYDAYRLSIDPNDFRDAGWLDGKGSLVSEAYSKFFSDLGKYTGITQRAEERQRAYNEELSTTKDVSAAVRKAFADCSVSSKSFSGELSETQTVSEVAKRGLAALSDSVKSTGSVLNQYGSNRVKEFKDELKDLQLELDFGDNDYLKSLAQLDLWKQRELNDKNYVSADERIAIEELYAAKSEQIEQERADKLAEIRDKIAAEDRTAFENRLADIEKEKDSWIQVGMDKLEADELAQKKREQLEKEVAEKVSDIRKSINAEFQTDLQNQIEKIQDEQQAWVDMGVAASEAAELAGQKMELAFEKAVDKAKSLNQSLEDKIFA